MSYPKNEPISVPGKGLSKGGSVEGLHSSHLPADQMAPHDTNTLSMKPDKGSTYPASPAHSDTINLENAESHADKITPNDCNMQSGLGATPVPGKGLV